MMADGAMKVLFIAFFTVIYFPGGTILMAVSCDARRLDGWDWVLSVVIPAYGFLKSIFSRSCIGVLS